MPKSISSQSPVTNEKLRISERISAEMQFIRDRRIAKSASSAKVSGIDAAIKAIPEAVSNHGSSLQFPDFGQDKAELIGLALSGGGLRSASVCLGALQAMNSVGTLDRVDYLSTVSGGGYIGGSYVATSHAREGAFCFDTQQGQNAATGPLNVGDTLAVQHLRDHSNFLAPRGIGDLLQDIAVVIRGLVTSAFVIAPFVMIAAAVTILLYSHPSLAPHIDERLYQLGGNSSTFWPWLAGAIFGVMVLWSIGRSYSMKSEFEGKSASGFAWLMVFLVAFGFLLFQNWLLEGMLSRSQFPQEKLATDSDWQFPSLLVSTLLGSPLLAVVIAFFRNQLIAVAKAQSERLRDIIASQASRLLLLIGSAILPVALWLIYLNLVHAGLVRQLGSKQSEIICIGSVLALDRTTLVLGAVALLGLLISAVIGDNAYSLHGLYRDRLRKAFLDIPDAGGATGTSALQLHELVKGWHPYPIFNTALNVQGSTAVNRRGRNADFFSFTPHFSGSPSTGYLESDRIMDPKNGKGIDIATVMAVSGAAAAANMGVNSYRSMAFTLAALNIRLGFWLANPAQPKASRWSEGFYLWNEMTSALDENRTKVLLTDGGHVENLGLYELLRRRCKVIVVIDAEADPEMSFASFYQLERFARIDMGARITIDLAPIAEATRAQMNANRGKGERPEIARGPHAALGTIHYDGTASGEGQTSFLLYVKSSLTGDEPDYVRDYARRNPAFPHETTADLFYSEEQFEAYRALGFHMVRRALNSYDKIVLPGKDASSYLGGLDGGKPKSISAEFCRILELGVTTRTSRKV